ncbi:hypothetical protein, partial [Nitrobacter sp. 62-23]|uniref:hypothetical protein n=1 Tax=Nitrobacter sp. 62-23 TaxID=1895798 RepID=UPI0025F9D972
MRMASPLTTTMGRLKSMRSGKGPFSRYCLRSLFRSRSEVGACFAMLVFYCHRPPTRRLERIKLA